MRPASAPLISAYSDAYWNVLMFTVFVPVGALTAAVGQREVLIQLQAPGIGGVGVVTQMVNVGVDETVEK